MDESSGKENIMTRFTWKTRALSVFLAVLLAVLTVPLTAYAEILEDPRSDIGAGSDTETQERAYDGVFEDTSRREESVKHFRLADGSYIAYRYEGAVHIQDEEGVWQDINNHLYDNGSEFSSSDARIKFAKKITGNETVFTLHEGNHKITVSLDGAIKKTVGEAVNTETEFDESATLLQKLTTLDHLSARVSYADILENIDLQYALNGRNVKELLLVKAPQEENTWSFTLQLNNLRAELTEEGSVHLLDGDEILYRIPAPTVWDHAGVNAAEDEAWYTLESIGTDCYRLSVTVSDDWMRAVDRAYPVTVDPTISGTAGSMSDTYVYEGAKSSSYGNDTSLYVGENSSYYEYVSFFKITALPTLPAGATVISSKIRLYCRDFVTYSASYLNVGVYEATSAFTESSTWTGLGVTTAEPDSALLVDYARITSASEGNRVDWDVTELTKKWYRGGTNNGVYFRDVQAGREYAAFHSADASGDTAQTPLFEVQYRVINGVESYWTYRTQTAGLAGAGYVNMATGNLTFAFSGYSTDDGLMPYTPSLVYNTPQKGKYFNSSFGNTNMVANTGYGWKLDSQQSVVQRGYTNTSGGLTYYYVWMDADGTEHAFMPFTASSGTVYYDEDGLNLELVVLSAVTDGVKYQIKDTHGNVMGFSSIGYLVKETDSFGNERIYTRNGARLTSVSLKPSGGTAIEQIRFHYYSGSEATVLSEMEYVDTNKRIRLYYSDTYGGVYSQSKTRYLRKVEFCRYDSDTATYTSDASVLYSYASTSHLSVANDTFSAYSVNYTYTSDRVTLASEYANSSLGQRVGFTYQDGKSTYRTSGLDDVYNTADDLLTTMLFDHANRVITTYMTDVNQTVLYGSSTSDYVELPDGVTTSEAAKQVNKIKTAASASVNSANLLLDGGFEDTTKANWSALNSAALSVYAIAANHGNYGMRLSFGSGQTSAGLTQSVYLTPGTYTFSINHRKYNTSSSTSAISLLTPSGVTVVSQNSTATYTSTTPLSSTFSPLYMTFTVTSAGTYSLGVSVTRESTSYSQFYFLDDAVLIRGNAIGTPSLLENGGFESGADAGWDRTGLSLSTTNVHTGRYALMLESGLTDFVTEGETVSLLKSNTITAIQGNASYGANTEQKSYVLSGWAKANAVRQNEDRLFGFLIFVNYAVPGSTAAVYDTFFMPFNADTSEWQYGSMAIITDPTKGYPMSIEVYCQYSYNNGAAYFDDITLIESTDTVDYTYDAKGRVTAAVNGNGYDSQAVTYYDDSDFDAGGEIKTVTYADGRVTTYQYDRHKVSFSQTVDQNNRDLGTEMKLFDSYGNPVEVMAYGADTDTVVTAYTYSTDHAIFGKLLTAEDTTGLVTTYHYDTDTRYLMAVTTSDGVGTAYTFDALGRQISARPAAVSGSSYTAETGTEQAIFAYDGSKLSSITTGSSTYHFTYDNYQNRKSVAVGSNQIAYYIYNSYNGKLIYTVYANGYVTKNVYDELDRISQVWYTQITGSLPTSDSAYDGYTYSLKESYVYDEMSFLAIMTDHVAGTKTVYSYDTEGKPVGAVRFGTSGTAAVFYQNVTYNSVGLVSKNVDGYALNGIKYTDTSTYVYDSMQRLTAMYYGVLNSANSYTYSYDGLSRVTNRTLTYGGLTVAQTYSYAEGQGSFGYTTTGRVETLTQTVGSTATTYTYSYDARGNITHIYVGGVLKYSYVYDNLNQLTRENNAVANKTYVYTYDDAGNILTKRTYAYTTGTLGSVQSTNTYTYGNSSWGDQLTAFNGTSITYDALGNPKSYNNGSSYTLAWAKGRQLSAVLHNSKTTTFSYNADGIRTKKVGTTTVEYILNGTQIVAEMNGSNVIRYVYDAQGLPVGMILNGTTYLYEKNLQGDVIGIYNTSGTKVASYSYDAWGNLISSSYSDYSAYTYNPFRYRGYYYDRETGFYYLQSRYYDPATGRFINADGYVNANGDLQGYNMYAYCSNNPVMCVDPTGEGWFWDAFGAIVAAGFGVVGITVRNHIVNACVAPDDAELKDSYTMDEAENAINDILSKYSSNRITASFVQETTENNEIIEYMHITNSWQVTSRADRAKVCEIIARTKDENGNLWTTREADDMASEWLGHNVLYNPNAKDEKSRTKDVDINQNADDDAWWIRGITNILEFFGWE